MSNPVLPCRTRGAQVGQSQTAMRATRLWVCERTLAPSPVVNILRAPYACASPCGAGGLPRLPRGRGVAMASRRPAAASFRGKPLHAASFSFNTRNAEPTSLSRTNTCIGYSSFGSVTCLAWSRVSIAGEAGARCSRPPRAASFSPLIHLRACLSRGRATADAVADQVSRREGHPPRY